jgi:hypothetical protein
MNGCCWCGAIGSCWNAGGGSCLAALGDRRRQQDSERDYCVMPSVARANLVTIAITHPAAFHLVLASRDLAIVERAKGIELS